MVINLYSINIVNVYSMNGTAVGVLFSLVFKSKIGFLK